MPSLVVVPVATVSLVDATTADARANDTEGQDDAHLSGIMLNDVRQGSLGDCFFMAAVGAMAQRTPAALTGIGPNAAGAATVQYFARVGGPALQATVDMTLDYGLEQAQLSMDYYDDPNTPTVRAYEVWPQVFEKAYASVVGRGVMVKGGKAENVWQHLTGQQATAAPVPRNNLVQELRAALGASKKVVMTTPGEEKDKGEMHPTDSPAPLYGGHSYVLTGFEGQGQNEKATFYNPHGGEHPTVLLTELPKFFNTTRIQ